MKAFLYTFVASMFLFLNTTARAQQVTTGPEIKLPVITNSRVAVATPVATPTAAGFQSFGSQVINPSAMMGTASMTYAAPPVIPFAVLPAAATPAPLIPQAGINTAYLLDQTQMPGYGYASAMTPGFHYAFQMAPNPTATTTVPTEIGLASLNSQPAAQVSIGVSNRISMDFNSFRPVGSYGTISNVGFGAFSR